MALTGRPLIALTLLATAAVITATILLWSRSGRWRLVLRPAGVLLCEALVVLSAGLIVNRHEQFYPSWQALAGDTGPAPATAERAAGRLDSSFGPRLTVTWRPPGSAAWRLAGGTTVSVPRGYLGARGSVPALIALGGRPAGADLVRVAADPTKQTTATALAGLPSALAAELRLTGHGWALLASSTDADLAARLAGVDPGRFAALVVVGALPAGFRPPPFVAVAVARPATTHGRLPHGVTGLTGSWTAATRWAAAQTPAPLAAPEVLPAVA